MENNNMLKFNNDLICLKYEYQLKQKKQSHETELCKIILHFQLLTKIFLEKFFFKKNRIPNSKV